MFGLSHAVDDGLRQVGRTGAALREAGVRDDGFGAGLERQLAHQRELRRGVGREAVDRDDARQAVLLDDLHVRREVVGALARARRGPRCASTLNGLPPCDLVARTVVTSTAALGANPPTRQTMSQNFWKPRSLAKPASVTT